MDVNTITSDNTNASEAQEQPPKEPWLYVILSFLVPGLGQFYNGRRISGLLFFIINGIISGCGYYCILSRNGDPKIGIGLLLLSAVIFVLNMINAFLISQKSNPINFERFRQGQKDPSLGIFLSLIFPGLGHLYLGKWLVGVAFIAGESIALNYKSVRLISLVEVSVSIASAYHIYSTSKIRQLYFHQFRNLFFLMFACLYFHYLTSYVLFNYYSTITRTIGSSSYPTLQDGDRIVIDIWGKNNIKRGDFVSIQGGLVIQNEIICKRIIAFEKETVEIKQGTVFVNDKRIEIEPIASIRYTTDTTCNFAREGHPYTVPKGYVFLLGDNSEKSTDSRYFGPIELNHIHGVVSKIIWPPSHIRKL